MRALAIVGLVVTVLICALGSFRDFRDAGKADKTLASAKENAAKAGAATAIKSAVADAESLILKTRIGGVLFAVGLVAAIASIVLLVRRGNVNVALAVMFVAIVIGTFLSPTETSRMQGTAVRSIGYIAIIAAIVAAGLSFVAARRSPARAA